MGTELYIPVGMGGLSVNRGLEFVSFPSHQYVQKWDILFSLNGELDGGVLMV